MMQRPPDPESAQLPQQGWRAAVDCEADYDEGWRPTKGCCADFAANVACLEAEEKLRLRQAMRWPQRSRPSPVERRSAGHAAPQTTAREPSGPPPIPHIPTPSLPRRADPARPEWPPQAPQSLAPARAGGRGEKRGEGTQFYMRCAVGEQQSKPGRRTQAVAATRVTGTQTASRRIPAPTSAHRTATWQGE